MYIFMYSLENPTQKSSMRLQAARKTGRRAGSSWIGHLDWTPKLTTQIGPQIGHPGWTLGLDNWVGHLGWIPGPDTQAGHLDPNNRTVRNGTSHRIQYHLILLFML